MRRFRVDCPFCGDVVVPAGDIAVEPSTYGFDCPSCDLPVRLPATRRETQLLQAHGARVVTAASVAAAGPPLTMDDVITLHDLLQQPDWLQLLLAVPTSGPSGIPAQRARRPLASPPEG